MERIEYNISIWEKYFCYFLEYVFFYFHKDTRKSYQLMLQFGWYVVLTLKLHLHLLMFLNFISVATDISSGAYYIKIL